MVSPTQLCWRYHSLPLRQRILSSSEKFPSVLKHLPVPYIIWKPIWSALVSLGSYTSRFGIQRAWGCLTDLVQNTCHYEASVEKTLCKEVPYDMFRTCSYLTFMGWNIFRKLEYLHLVQINIIIIISWVCSSVHSSALSKWCYHSNYSRISAISLKLGGDVYCTMKQLHIENGHAWLIFVCLTEFWNFLW